MFVYISMRLDILILLVLMPGIRLSFSHICQVLTISFLVGTVRHFKPPAEMFLPQFSNWARNSGLADWIRLLK